MNTSRDPLSSWVLLARILRPRGNKGEVLAELLGDFSERLSSLPFVYLAASGAAPRRVALKSFWIDRNHPGQGIFHFEGSASISDAEAFRHQEVFLPIEERVALPAGKYFVTDLIGCTVVEIHPSREPRALGAVRDVFFPGEDQPGTPLLQLLLPSGEVLIPFAEDICTKIDTAARRIEVILPEGLLDPGAAE